METKEKKQIVYILSALEATEENIKAALKRRFQRITPDYILVYDEDLQENSVEIKADDLKELTDQDFEWLQGCNMILLSEFLQNHEDSQKKSFRGFMEELENNIKKEFQKEKDSEEGVE